MIWSRKPAAVPPPSRSRLAGLDLTASRARALVGPAAGPGPVRPLALDGDSEELPLALDLRGRAPLVGRAAAGKARREPHAVARGFLPMLGAAKAWPTAGRHPADAEALLRHVFERLRVPVAAESEAAGLVVPGYLTPQQVQKLHAAARAAKLTLLGSASVALALVAHRAGSEGESAGDAVPVGAEGAGGSSVLPPAHRPADAGNIFDAPGRGGVVVVDADAAGLTASGVEIDGDECVLVGQAVWPKLGEAAWLDRLLAGVADRCVRVARRDPRDSADAEQALVDQFGAALASAASGLPTVLGVRVGHWYQELPHRPEELAGYVTPLARQAGTAVREFVWGLPMPAPPRSLWLTTAAARLPGLAAALHGTSPERTSVEPLGDAAPAEAALALASRWKAGTLPPNHYDSRLPLAEAASTPRDAHPFEARRKPGDDRPRLYTQSG